MQVYLARALLPVASPVIRDGAVAIDDGRIVAVGSRAEVMRAVGEGAEIRDLGDSVLIPGLINAHTHLELSWLKDDPPPGGDFVAWLRELLNRRDEADEERMRSAAEEALRVIADRGTVAVGDVANGTWTGPVLARSGLHGVVFHELYGLNSEAAEAALEEAADHLELLNQDPDVTAAAGRVRISLAPHAPHTTSPPLLKALAGRSAACGEPLSIHVAESQAEISFLKDGGGSLADLFRERGFWDDKWSPPGSSPVRYLHRLGVLSPLTLTVHCVHIDRQDHSLLQASRVNVVTCPRSNEALGVGKAPIPTLLGEGVPVALGTDSLASVPDLDLFAEMAALLRAHSGLSPAAVLRMATLNGARALGVAERLGTIETGKLAELVVVPLPEPDVKPFEVVCSNPPQVHRLADAPWEPGS